AYPVDGLSVPTVLCIGDHDAASHVISIDVDISINQKLSCTTHPVITSVCTGQNEINLPASVNVMEVSSGFEYFLLTFN
ncbi:unnamed protein product, partial [Adineta ricciae]